MKTSALFPVSSLFFFAFLSVVQAAGEAPTEPRIRVGDLKSGELTIDGALGVALGTPCRIKVIIEEVPPSGKPDIKQYQFDVLEVNGVMVSAPLKLAFRVPPYVATNVAPNRVELDRLIAQLMTPEGRSRYSKEFMAIVDDEAMSVEEANSFRKMYVGSEHILLVYETGAFTGAPDSVPIEFDANVAGKSTFGFENWLVVLGEYRNS